MTKKQWTAWRDCIEAIGPYLSELVDLEASADDYDELSDKRKEMPIGTALSLIRELDASGFSDRLNEIDAAIDDIE
jgi:hypothetical protein